MLPEILRLIWAESVLDPSFRSTRNEFKSEGAVLAHPDGCATRNRIISVTATNVVALQSDQEVTEVSVHKIKTRFRLRTPQDEY